MPLGLMSSTDCRRFLGLTGRGAALHVAALTWWLPCNALGKVRGRVTVTHPCSFTLWFCMWSAKRSSTEILQANQQRYPRGGFRIIFQRRVGRTQSGSGGGNLGMGVQRARTTGPSRAKCQCCGAAAAPACFAVGCALGFNECVLVLITDAFVPDTSVVAGLHHTALFIREMKAGGLQASQKAVEVIRRVDHKPTTA